MTPQGKRTLIAIGLLVLALVVGIGAVWMLMSGPAQRTVTVSAPATTRKAYAHNVSAALGWLDLSRQAIVEADLSDAERRSALVVMDKYNADLRAMLNDDTLSGKNLTAKTADLRDAWIADLQKTGGAFDAMKHEEAAIWFELDLLSRRRLLPLMFDTLDMTDAQHKSADAAFMEVSVILRNEPAGGMPNERSMKAMLTGRDKLHALLTPDQRTKFEQVLRDEREKRQRPTLSFRPATTRPAATTPATQPAR